jgi:hypothetical protein
MSLDLEGCDILVIGVLMAFFAAAASRSGISMLVIYPSIDLLLDLLKLLNSADIFVYFI